MKIKMKDIYLAIEYLQQNSTSEWLEIDTNEAGGSATSFAFTDKNAKACKVFVYEANRGITPELRTTQKLYRKAE
jgi:hypothetical protein